MSPTVSVIMPVYNAGKFVAAAITSVLNQSWNDWELLIINDGSTDDSESIVRLYTDPRIQYFSQPNRGVSAARNVGLARMKGTYFCFLDADDVLSKDSLRSRLKIFENNPDINFVDGVVKIFNQDLSKEIRQWKPSFEGNPFPLLIRLDERVFFGPTWMVRRKTGADYKMDEGLTHGEDIYFFMGLAKQGRYAFTEEVVLHYRKSTTSAMANLRGLAHGYTKLRQRINEHFGPDISISSRLILQIKTRKIMFLSFWNAGLRHEAWQYLFKGKIS